MALVKHWDSSATSSAVYTKTKLVNPHHLPDTHTHFIIIFTNCLIQILHCCIQKETIWMTMPPS
jgi:hypothetical protein